MCCISTKQKSKLIIQAHYFPTFLYYFRRFQNLIFRRSFLQFLVYLVSVGPFRKHKPLPYSYGNPYNQEYDYHGPRYAKADTSGGPSPSLSAPPGSQSFQNEAPPNRAKVTINVKNTTTMTETIITTNIFLVLFNCLTISSIIWKIFLCGFLVVLLGLSH